MVVECPSGWLHATCDAPDNGNLVLYDADGGVVWLGFEHPSGSLLPGMRVGLASGSGNNFSLAAWTTPSNLTPGPIVRRPGAVHPERLLEALSLRVLSRLVLNSWDAGSGLLQRWTWAETESRGKWNLDWFVPSKADQCDTVLNSSAPTASAMKEAPPPSVSNHAMRGIIQSLATLQVRLLRLELVVTLRALILPVVVDWWSTEACTAGSTATCSMASWGWPTPVAVSYAVGPIQDGPFHDETFVLWATALLLIQASAMSSSELKVLRIQSVLATGCCQQQCVSSQRKKQVLQHVLQTGLVLCYGSSSTLDAATPATGSSFGCSGR
ncbi:hypothetical protein PR202_ga05582 [Eleusine coracana subsp. coracana]|uniref:non-specific serine/threonine protein kinase n=1 Tax=Eleusine coracana subsp. coracana TaxID=191504 RepID=A0AAV5BT84_ELECO|nr:hypothetical protein PR202_ga05128 [Eleusine coracana subsp. coracana]GJM89391.1 hypothetical protein PR202_ga05582 [Eleusine coracana subsp. coracana]